MTPEEIWLNYFNRILFQKGLIDEKEKNKMNYLIYRKYHGKQNQKTS